MFDDEIIACFTIGAILCIALGVIIGYFAKGLLQ